MKALLAAALAASSVLLAPTSHADPSANDKFLSCLANHNVQYNDRDLMLDLGGRIQNDLRNGVAETVIIRNLLVNYDVPLSIAKIDIQCVEATMVSNGETIDHLLPPADGKMWVGIIV